MKRKPLVTWFPFRFALLIAPLVAAWPQPSRAADLWWDNTGGTANDWGGLANWSTVVGGGTDPAALPAAGDLVKFSATPIIGTAQTVNLTANRSVLGLDFLSTVTAATTLAGGGTNRTLTLAGSGIVKAGTGAVTIGSATAGQQVAFLLSADQTWANNNTGVLTIQNTVGASTAVNRKLTLGGTSTAANIINGVIANNGTGVFSLDKTGAGLWALAGANTFSGAVTVTAGTLRVANGSALGTNTAVAVNVGTVTGGQGTTLDLQGTITIGAGKTVTLNSTTTGGDFRTTLLNGANNNTWAGNLVAAGTGLVQVNSTSGTLTVNGTVTSTGGAGTGTLFTRGAGNVVYNGVINLGSDRIFNKTDAGTVIVNSTGNSWVRTQAANGQIQIGINNALDTGKEFAFGQTGAGDGRLELNGFSQTVTRLNTFAASTGSHTLRNSNLTTASTLTFATPAATTDTLTNLQVQGTATGLGTLNLVSNGLGRTEFNGGLFAANSWTVNSGTLVFTGTNNRSLPGSVTGLAAATIEKAGAATLASTGPWNNAGTTNVTGGALVLGTGAAGAINVSDTATLSTGLGGGVLTSSAVTFGTGGATTYVPLLTNAAVAPLTATTLTNAGTVTVAPQAGSFTANTTYRLLDYTSVSGLGGFTLAPLGSYPHITATLNTSTPGQINLVVGAVDSLIWAGQTSGVWDVNTTSNFALASSPGTGSPFYQGDAVVFGDTHDVGGAGTPVTNSTLTGGAVTISNLSFNNSAVTYSVANPLTGAGGITKSGTATVTLSGNNSYAGATTVSNGTLTLSGANTLGGGAVNVTGATLRIGNSDALRGAGLVTVSGGGTFDANGTAVGARYPELVVSGAGVDTNADLIGDGAIVNTGAAITNNSHFAKITLAGDTTWGGSGRYDLVAGQIFNGGAFTLTKTGTGELWYNPSAGSVLENVVVNGGFFGSQGANPLSTTATVTVNSGGTHQVFAANAQQHKVVLNDGGILRQSNNAAGTINGQVTLNTIGAGRNIQAVTGGTLNIAGKLTGPGGFTVNDAGTVQLQNAANDYAGDTVISLGTLNFSATGILPATANLIVNGGTFATGNLPRTVPSLSGTGGTINGGNVLTTTQSTTTVWNGQLSGTTAQMSGSGGLTLGGTVDNNSGIAILNSGTMIFAKGNTTPVAQAIHSVGSGLTINGGTLQLGGSYDNTTTPGTAVNLAPGGIDPLTYVDQIYNGIATINLNAGTFDLNGRQEAVNALANPAGAGSLVTNSSATAAKLFFGYAGSTGGGTGTFGGSLNDGVGILALEKTGSGTQTLTGTSNFSGGMTVSNGTLVQDGTFSGAGAISLTGTATFAGAGTSAGTLTAATGTTVRVGTVSGGTAATTLTLGGLNLSGGANLNLDFNPAGTTLDKIATTATNGLSISGANPLNVVLSGAGWVPGTYPILTYTGAVQGTGASNATLVLSTSVGHSTVNVVDNGTGSVNLVVSGAANKWVGGVSSAWDTDSTLNWNAGDQKFLTGDTVVFDDTATTFTPNIAANQTAAGVTFDNSLAFPYTLTSTGAFGIAGTGGLIKKNTGTATLSSANTYTGATDVQQGTLIANYNTGTAQTVFAPAGIINVAPGATFKAVANDSNFTLANNLTGSGLVVIDPHLTAGAGVREVVIFGTNAGFTGTLLLSPTVLGDGLGSFRTNAALTPARAGGATIEVDPGGQAWLAAGTFPNNFILAGHGFAETAGGTPVAGSGLTPYSGTLKGGIGAIRMDATTISGNIMLDGAAKIMPYNTTGTLSGSIFLTNPADLLSVGGGGAGSTLILTGVNNTAANALNQVFVNAGGTAGTNVLQIGSLGTTGTLGTGTVTLYNDGAGAQLRIQRSDGYTLAQNVTAAHNGTPANLTKAGFVSNTQGTGVSINGNTIDLTDGTGTAANAGGVFVAGVAGGNGVNNAILNIDSSSTIKTGQLFIGDASGSSGTVNQSGTSSVQVASHVRVGHYPNNTSTYNFSAGTLTLANINTATDPSGGVEQTGGIYLGVDGTGTMAQSGGTVTTDWIVLDNRGDTVAGTNMPDGIDRYTLTNGTLILRSQWGIAQRNATTAVTLGGGTIRNGGTNLQVRLDTAPDIAGVVTLDTVSAGNSFNWLRNATGAGSLALSGGGRLKFTTALTQSVAVPLTGTGAVEKLGVGTTTLSAANTYSGNTIVSAGVLTITNAPDPLNANSGNDASTVTIAATGATLSLTYTGTDKVNSFFIGSTQRAAGVYGHTNSGANNGGLGVGAMDAYFGPGTGTLTVASGNSFASWINGFFPGETNLSIIGAGADPDRDGIPNGVEMVIGGNPSLDMDAALLPTIELVTNPVSLPAIPAGDYLLFTYRRTDLSVSSSVASDCEIDPDLLAPWTAATGAPGVVIQVDDDFAFTPPAAATDRVRVYVPRGVNPTIFGRLKVTVP